MSLAMLQELACSAQDLANNYLQSLKDIFGNTIDDVRQIFSRKSWDWPDFQEIANKLHQPSYRVIAVAVCSLALPLVVIKACWMLCSKSQTKDRHIFVRPSNVRKSVEKPDSVHEARRWLRQAGYDVEAAKHDVEAENEAHEWACFKCQQAAEKAIKAVLILQTQQYEEIHDLHQMSLHTQDKVIIKASRDLQGLLGFVGRMRYPEFLRYPRVPHDVYTSEESGKAIEYTEKLLGHITQKYMGDWIRTP